MKDVNNQLHEVDTQAVVPVELMKDQKKKDIGPLPVRKVIARWGLVFIIFYTLFFLLYFNYASKLNLPKAPGDIIVEKPSYSLYIPLVSTLIFTISIDKKTGFWPIIILTI